ncbi:DsbA family oxidoreductase [Magnetovibrio sp.]|uniref:DsbA family oxidoreductase n=1 Tax=Magnetovibrio sp. TaxID=2024836 RepID=UPI002F9598CE
MQIDVFFDPICPWCFIGKRRLQRALGLRASISATLTWRPFMLNPEMPPAGMERHAYLLNKFGTESRVRRLLGALEATGQSEEIAFQFDRIHHTPNTVNAHRLVHYADEFGLAESVVERLYQAYFLEGRDTGDLDELSAIGRSVSLESSALDAYLDSSTDVSWVREQNALAHRMGVNGVPCFLVDGQLALQGAQPPEVLARLLDAGAAA